MPWSADAWRNMNLMRNPDLELSSSDDECHSDDSGLGGEDLAEHLERSCRQKPFGLGLSNFQNRAIHVTNKRCFRDMNNQKRCEEKKKARNEVGKPKVDMDPAKDEDTRKAATDSVDKGSLLEPKVDVDPAKVEDTRKTATESVDKGSLLD